MDECQCERVVRLVMPSNAVGTQKTYWICNVCNAQFLPKKAVDYKLEHLAETLARFVQEGKVSYEQVARMWNETSVSE